MAELSDPEERPVRFGVLGVVQAHTRQGLSVDLGGRRRRAVLAALVADAGQIVGVDRLAHRTWRGAPPPAATATLQAYISQLRRLLDPEREREPDQTIITVGGGYLLRAEPDEIDATRFALLLARAEELLTGGRAEESVTTVDRALALWRGGPYPELDHDPDLEAAITALREQRLRALDVKARALLLAGRAADAATLAQALVTEQPLRERYWEHLMLANHRDGRTADALATYRRARETLSAELGIDPGPGLTELHTAILQRDPSLDPPAPSLDRPPVAPSVIGRERELTLVSRALDAAVAGRGEIIVLEGEPGVGKTHLAEAIRTLAVGRKCATAWASAVDDLGAPPLWLWEQVLTRLGRAIPTADVGDADPATARFRLCQEVVATLVAAAAERPLLVVLDDLQWADAASLQTLRLLGGSLREAPVLVLATRRDGDAHNVAAVEATLATLPHRGIRLEPFDAADVRALVERHGAAPLDTDTLYRRTGGNAFFLTELLRLLDDGYDIGKIPDTVRLVIEQRYLRLPQPTRQVLGLAALAGADLDPALLAHCVGEKDTATLTGLLEPALAVGLLRHDVERWTWRFAHDLAREALEGRLGPQERARLHGVLADAIEAVYGPGAERQLDDLARHRFHAAQGAPDEQAYEACVAAAEHAYRRHAFDQASRHRERAMALLGPGDPRRHGTLLKLTAEQHLIHLNDKDFYQLVHRLWTEAGDDIEKLSATAAVACVPRLWHWRGDRPQASREIVATIHRLLADSTDPRRRVDLLGALAMEMFYDEEYDAGRASDAFSEQALTIARSLGDVPLLGRALNLHVFGVWRPGGHQAILDLTDEALSYAGSGLPGLTEFIARTHRSMALLALGRIEEYREELRACRTIAAWLGIPSIDSQVVYQRITDLQLRGRWDEARDLIARHDEQMGRVGFWLRTWARAVQLSGTERASDRPIGDLMFLGKHAKPMRATAALAVAENGDLQRARRLFDRWRLEEILGESRWYVDCVAAELGELAVLTGVPDRAMIYRTLLAQRGQLAVHSTAMRCGGPIDLILAKLAHTLGRSNQAREHLRAAERYEEVPGFAHLFTRAEDLLAS